MHPLARRIVSPPLRDLQPRGGSLRPREFPISRPRRAAPRPLRFDARALLAQDAYRQEQSSHGLGPLGQDGCGAALSVISQSLVVRYELAVITRAGLAGDFEFECRMVDPEPQLQACLDLRFDSLDSGKLATGNC